MMRTLGSIFRVFAAPSTQFTGISARTNRKYLSNFLAIALALTGLQAIAVSSAPVASAASGDPGSISFGNSAKTNYLTYPKTSAFGFGTSDFTIEFWYKPTVGGRNDVFDLKNQAPGETEITRMDIGAGIGTGNIELYTDGGCAISTSKSFTLNTWMHLALTRNGNNLNLWVNGALGGTTACSKN